MKRKQNVFRFCIGQTLFYTILLVEAGYIFASANANPNDQAWRMLVDNKPLEAKEIFTKNTGLTDKAVVAEAYRGLSEVAHFIGDDLQEASARFKSYRADQQPALLAAGLLTSYSFGRAADGYKVKDGYRLLRELGKKPSLFSGQFNDLLVERYANDGDIAKAFRIISDMAVARTWMFIGPFDNVSNCGYSKVYPPEQEIDFSRIYPGKDGNDAQWNVLDNKAPTGWIFTEQHSDARNAVFYYYCSVCSKTSCKAYLSFGASGAFRIFLNGVCVCADSVFRNTGTDAFMLRVKLQKGDNPLLIKLCHEWGQNVSEDAKLSNFQLRFLDTAMVPCKNLIYSRAPVTVAKGYQQCAYAPSPLADSIVSMLTARLQRNSDDMDAAFLLMKAYNGLEKTDSGHVFARAYLKKHPQSSIWHSLYAESLLRAKQYTEGESELRTAYASCPQNAFAWVSQLHSVAGRSDPRKILDFIEKSPEPVRSSPSALIATINADIAWENKAEVLATADVLEKKYPFDESAIELLADMYIEQGDVKKAETVIRKFLAHKRTDSRLYKLLASIALKKGDLAKTTGIIYESLKYDPEDASQLYTLASVSYAGKKYAQARKYIDNCLYIMPADADALNLKGNILVSLGKTAEAKQTFTGAIRFTSDDFNAWENLRTLQRKPPLEAFAPLPSVDSLIAATRNWGQRSDESGAILSWIEDMFYYPSHCSRQRTFFVIALPTQKAIDTWKEYAVDYNSHFQALHINRALTYRSDGSQIMADVSKNRIVFKSLQPGDCIVVEWSIKNYFMGEMATHAYGSQEFEFSYPVFDSRLRLVTPLGDTVPYHVYGDSILVSTLSYDDYRVTELRRPAYKNVLDETFTATEWPEKKKVTYSTFSSWSDIVQWYDGLTRRKHDNTLELKALADSLFTGCATDAEKVAKIHNFITGSIRYSYVPFRQSGWIPQEAHDVLATKIGDCKDMASLGKSLCDLARVPSCLVLVNTMVRHYTDHTAIGPDFNHCILCCTVGGADRFIDLTASNFAVTSLPKEDQGAMALLIRPGTDRVITLPFDKPEQNVKQRSVTSSITPEGNLTESMTTLRKGRFAGEYRERFRFLSDEKKKSDMHQILAQTYRDVTIDSLVLTGLAPLSDSLSSTVSYTARNTVTFSGSAAIFPLRFFDNVEADDYPLEEKRSFLIDMSRAWYDISQTEQSGVITYPASWRPITLPQNISLDSPYGSYRLHFSHQGNTISYHRIAIFSFDKQIPVSEYQRLKTFLSKISKSDVVQLLFFTK